MWVCPCFMRWSSGQFITSCWSWRFLSWIRTLCWRWHWGLTTREKNTGSVCRYRRSYLSPLSALYHWKVFLPGLAGLWQRRVFVCVCAAVRKAQQPTEWWWLTPRSCVRSTPSSWRTLEVGSTSRRTSTSSLSACLSSPLSGGAPVWSHELFCRPTCDAPAGSSSYIYLCFFVSGERSRCAWTTSTSDEALRGCTTLCKCVSTDQHE